MQLLRHLVTLTCVSVHQQSGSLFNRSPSVCSIPTLVYLGCPSVLSSCCRLSCYVFVYFGNGFQVAIVAHVVRWLMGKTQLLQSPALLPSQSHSWTQPREQVPSSSFDKVTHWHPDAHFLDQRAVPLNQGDFAENKVESVCLWLQKGRLRLHAWTVWGSLYSSAMSPHGGGLIGGPKEPPVLSSSLTKALGCGCVEDGGEAIGIGDEQVSHRMAGWDEL